MKLAQSPLGQTGLQVSPIGLGTVKWGRNQGLKHGPFDLPATPVIEALLDAALDAGVNVLDTAPAYGIAEERIGACLGTRRDQFLLFTKTGEIFENGASRWDFSAKHTRQSVEESLRRLRTDRLDGVLLHCPPNDVDVITGTPALEVLAEFRSRGLIRTIGVSTMSIAGGLLAAGIADVIMVSWNRNYLVEQPVIEAAAARGCGVFLKKTLFSGRINGAGVDGVSLAEGCLRPARALAGPPVPIVGTITPSHWIANIRAVA